MKSSVSSLIAVLAIVLVTFEGAMGGYNVLLRRAYKHKRNAINEE